MLELWNNVKEKYLDDYVPTKEDAIGNLFFQECLADTLDYIDTLLDINLEYPALIGKIEEIYKLCDNKRLLQMEKEFSSKNKDTFLFLRADKCWISNIAPKGNLYYLPDDMQIEAGDELPVIRKELVIAAKNVQDILEPAITLLKRSHSRRCLAMLLRAKWILLTDGHLPLEEKQCPALSKADWDEIHSLCVDYILFCNNEDSAPRPFALLLEGIWQWQFGDISEARDLFHQCEDQMSGHGFVLYERIGLCQLGTHSLRLFNVDVSQNKNGRFRATLKTEIAKDGSQIFGEPSMIGKNGVMISQTVLDYLFNHSRPVPKNNITKPVVVWFNAGGACLGLSP